jgi:hypothetical protein
MRIALWVFGLYVASERAIPHPCHFEEARNGWAAMPLRYEDGLAFKLIGVWERWDACWYARIAAYGYTPDGATAFFPLFPALERIVALGGPHTAAAGMLIGFVATVFALWGMYRIAARDHGDAVAGRSMLLLAVFPTAFFLLAPFSEATSLALSVWAIERARHHGGWPAAAVLATLAGLARPNGGFLALPLAWLAWRDLRDPRRAADGPWPLLAVVAAPASALLYVVYTARVVGRSMFDASAVWTGSAFHPPWDVAAAALEWTLGRGDPSQGLQLVMLVMSAALFAVGLRRIPVELSLYAAPQVLLVWSRILPTPLTSVGRYILVIFPLFIVLALLLGDRRLRWSYVILSLLLLGALANEFVIGTFVG